MKKLILSLLLISAALSAGAQDSEQNPELDLMLQTQNAPPKFVSQAYSVFPVPEGTMNYYYSDDPNTVTAQDGMKTYVVFMDKYPAGMYVYRDGEEVLLMDSDGDGILEDFPTDMFLPFWVVAYNTDDSLKTDNPKINDIFDELYEQYKSNSNPYTDGSHDSTLSELKELLLDDSLENRDLFYTLLCYYYFGSSDPYLAYDPIAFIDGACGRRFPEKHPLIYLHLTETLMNLRAFDYAKEILRELLSLDNEFVPARVYEWQMEDDETRKAELYKVLKETWPDHWIVSQI